MLLYTQYNIINTDFMEKLYKAGDATATTGLVIGIVPGLAAFFVAGVAKE